MHTVKENIKIVKIGRERSREGRGHDRYPCIYEVYIEDVTKRRVRVSGMLWWSKYTIKTESRWTYIGYHLSEQLAREIAAKYVGRYAEGEVIAEYSL